MRAKLSIVLAGLAFCGGISVGGGGRTAPAGLFTAAEACGMYRPAFEDDAPAMVASAERAAKKGDTRQAIRLFERAMNTEWAEPAVRVGAAIRAGELNAAVGKPRESLRRFQHAVEIDGRAFAARFALGGALAARGDLPGAEMQLAVAAAAPRASKSQQGDAHAALASVLARSGRLEAAAGEMAKARVKGANAPALAAAQSTLEAALAARSRPATAVAAAPTM